MAEVKWIKITTDMFDHDKLDFIESLPESDAIIVIWIRLLTLAGKANAGGYVFLTESIPYTEDMLSHRFRKPLSIIKLALETLKRLNMIDYDGDAILIRNWEKHQNVDGLERIRDQNKQRKRLERERKKQILISPTEMSRDSHVTVTEEVTPSHAIDIDKELDLEKHIYTFDEIKNLLNQYKVEYNGVFQVETVQSYGGMIDTSLILQAIKRSEGKNTGYVVKIIKDMIHNPEKYCEDKPARGSSTVGRTQKASYRKEPTMTEEERLRMERERPNERPIIDL